MHREMLFKMLISTTPIRNHRNRRGGLIITRKPFYGIIVVIISEIVLIVNRI